MSVFDIFKKQVKAAVNKPKLVFPEGNDARVLDAAFKLQAEGLVNVILLGNEQEICDQAASDHLNLTNIKIVDPETYPDFDEMCERFVEIRKGKNTLSDAKKMLKSVTYFGTMYVKMGLADGMVSGATHSTADTVRPALQIVKTSPNMKRVSGVMIMERGDERYIFADCAMNIDPDSETLAEIGYQAAKVAKMVEIDPKVAFLSFSTKGSANGPMVDKVKTAVAEFQKAHANIPADGELQFDAAFVESVGHRKAPDSKVAGEANVFVFPELQSGNIGYKIAQRLGNFTAVGPVLEGLAAPINDLSRGASAEDIYFMGILTAAQSLQKDE